MVSCPSSVDNNVRPATDHQLLTTDCAPFPLSSGHLRWRPRPDFVCCFTQATHFFVGEGAVEIAQAHAEVRVQFVVPLEQAAVISLPASRPLSNAS